jgi:Homeodomain-like domain
VRRVSGVREGLKDRPWEQLQGQIYLGSKEFIERVSAGNDEEIQEVPRAQLRPIRPTLERLFARAGEKAIVHAYREHGYRLREIAAHLGVHYATVSRRLSKLATWIDVAQQDLAPIPARGPDPRAIPGPFRRLRAILQAREDPVQQRGGHWTSYGTIIGASLTELCNLDKG